MKKRTLFFALFALVFAVACNKKAEFETYYYTEEETRILEQYINLPDFPFNYSISLPKHLKNAGLIARPVDMARASLGRVLFYDKNLSKDGTISCASCHKQALGFADNVAFSGGVYDRSTSRNSYALASVASFAAYYGTDLNGSSGIPFFWDNRAETAGEQSRGSLTNHLEMDMTMEEVVNAVAAQPYYEPLFKKAYGHFSVTEDMVLEALSNFVNAMGSFNSKFDQAADAQNGGSGFFNPTQFTSFSESEKRGLALYNTNCASCHSANMGRPAMLYANNGLDVNTSADQGVGGVTGNANQMGTFKVPTLRNIAQSAPYMHDGRFKTLEEVIDHYSSGIKNHPNLSWTLRNSQEPKKMNFTEQNKQDLIAFLNTLSDQTFLTAEQFSNPFKQ